MRNSIFNQAKENHDRKTPNFIKFNFVSQNRS